MGFPNVFFKSSNIVFRYGVKKDSSWIFYEDHFIFFQIMLRLCKGLIWDPIEVKCVMLWIVSDFESWQIWY